MSYQVTIETSHGTIIFPPYENWALAAVTASELAGLVEAGCTVNFEANGQAVQAGQAGQDYAAYMAACMAACEAITIKERQP